MVVLLPSTHSIVTLDQAGRQAKRRHCSPRPESTLWGAKTIQLDRAQDVRDLRAPPGNRLEALKGDRAGQHSIRINDRWRICFFWRDGDAHEVEIVDYHS
jgi:plasmid maintenance system killer protein